MRLDERLREYGFGEGTSKASQGWDEALNIVDEYFTELSTTYNKSTGELGVGPTSQTASSICRKYLRKLMKVAADNEEFYTEWKALGLGPSKFGFPYHWRLTDGSDEWFWSGDEESTVEDFESVYWEYYAG